MPLNTAVLLYEPTDEALPLALYDTMCRAIADAHRVDEVKDIRDKALAFEVYARQAQNFEAESRACQIRLRAERKAAKIYDAQEKAKGGEQYHATPTGSTAEPVPTLAQLGVSKRQMHDWRKLADVPEEQFEAALTESARPSTAGIIAGTTPPKLDTIPVSPQALWLWGRLRDFERDGLLTKEPRHVLLTMTPAMLDEVHRLAPLVARWLSYVGR
jgi:hypothetical protein